MNIQRNIIVNHIFGVQEPIFEFTFLANEYDDMTPAGRFEEMTAYMRATLAQHYHFGHYEAHTFLVEFYPTDAPEWRRQRTYGTIAAISAASFLGLYESMLQSDETLTLDGMRITVQLIGNQMNHEVYGAGCTHGARALPQHLRGRGLITHVWADTKKQSLEELGLCGILACLLQKNPDYLNKSEFWRWLEDAKRIGVELTITDGICRNEHFEGLLQLPGWEQYRIVIFSINRTIEFTATGPNW